MIKDDFSVEGTPSGALWKCYGNPVCRGGKLLLESSADLVVSARKLLWDEGATIEIVFDSGFGSMQLSRYDISKRPSDVEGVPYDSVDIGSGPSVRFIRDGAIYSSVTVYYPIKVTIQSQKDKISVYVEGKDWFGRPYPKTLLLETENRFLNQELFIYIAGGALAVDGIYAVEGRESLSYSMSVLLYSVMALVPLLILIPLMREMKKVVKPAE